MFTAAGCHGHPAAHGLWNIAGLCPRLSSSSGCFPPPWEVTTRRTQTTSLPSKQLIPLTHSPCWNLFQKPPLKTRWWGLWQNQALPRLLASLLLVSCGLPGKPAGQREWSCPLPSSSVLSAWLLGCQRAPCYILAWLWILWSISFKVCLAETAPSCLGSVLCRHSGHWLASCLGQLLPGLFWKVEIAESWPEVLR